MQLDGSSNIICGILNQLLATTSEKKLPTRVGSCKCDSWCNDE